MQRRNVVVGTGCAVLLALLAVPQASAMQGSTDAEANFNSGLAHLREGRSTLALEEFKRAVQKDSKNPYFYKGLGLAYASERKFGDAVDAFRKALEINPYYVDVRNDLGTALILAGKRAEGKAEFMSAFNDPTNPTPELSSRNLGQAYLEEKNFAEAFNWYRTSAGRNKQYPDAYLGLADALNSLGRTEEAVAHLETGVKECAAPPALTFALGEGYFRLGRFGEARAQLEATRKKDPFSRPGKRATDLLKQLPK